MQWDDLEWLRDDMLMYADDIAELQEMPLWEMGWPADDLSVVDVDELMDDAA